MHFILSAVAGALGSAVSIFVFSKIGFAKLKSAISNTSEPTESECSASPSMYYFAFLGIKAKGARAYTSEVFEISGEIPTQADIERVRQRVLAKNTDYKDCIVLAYNKVNA